MGRTALLVAAVVIVGLGADRTGAISDAEKCEAGKVKAAGQYAFCRQKADAKAIKKGETPDYSKCNAKFADKWAKLELKANGSCPVTGDADAVRTRATVATDGLTAAIGGAPRFVDNGDGTISDMFTGLMWEKKTELNGASNLGNLHDADNNLRWAGVCSLAPAQRCQSSAAAAAACAASVDGDASGCAQCGPGEGTCDAVLTVWDVIAGFNSANFAGQSDWRLPTVNELYSIVDYGTADSPTVGEAFAGASCGAACTDLANPACSCTESAGYWSATVHAPNLQNAWYVTFSEGFGGYDSVADVTLSVRAVRGGW